MYPLCLLLRLLEQHFHTQQPTPKARRTKTTIPPTTIPIMTFLDILILLLRCTVFCVPGVSYKGKLVIVRKLVHQNSQEQRAPTAIARTVPSGCVPGGQQYPSVSPIWSWSQQKKPPYWPCVVEFQSVHSLLAHTGSCWKVVSHEEPDENISLMPPSKLCTFGLGYQRKGNRIHD